jgi:hypothetical protein
MLGAHAWNTRFYHRHFVQLNKNHELNTRVEPCGLFYNYKKPHPDIIVGVIFVFPRKINIKKFNQL